MENDTKKFEEITSFIQKELSQLSDEVLINRMKLLA